MLTERGCARCFSRTWTIGQGYRRRCRPCFLVVVYCACVIAVWNINLPHVNHSPVSNSVNTSPRTVGLPADLVVNIENELDNDVATITSEHLTVHVIWFDPARTTFRFHEAMCLLSVQRFVRPRKILLWYHWTSTPPVGVWWQFARQSVAHLLPVPYERQTSVYKQTLMALEYQSDVARLAVLEQYGGLYLDLDVIVVRPVDALFTYKVAMGAETSLTLGSGFILATAANASFIRLWHREYADNFDDSDWNRHSVYVLMQLARQHPDLVHVEWFSIQRPNWNERHWLYTEGKLWDWSDNYAVHLWYREHPADVVYDPLRIRQLNTTTGEVLRLIYYEHTRLLPPIDDNTSVTSTTERLTALN